MALKRLENEQGYLKAGLLGYQKSGKSYTAALLAIGVRKFFNLKGPIAYFDTESGSGYLAPMVKEQTGTDLMGVRARSFAELMQFAQDCVAEKVSVAIVDSVTHPWRELCDSYLVQLNEMRRQKNWSALQKLEFQHWAAIKGMWQPWSDFFLNSPLHMIVCGRAGAIWEMEKNEETNRKELVQVGTKMKVEGEFGFEPSLLVEMERDQKPDGQGGFKLIHVATVLGDRFNVIDGRTEVNPTFEFFRPHIEKLKAGAHAPVDVTNRTQTGADEGGSVDWDRERKLRTILCEEIQGLIIEKHPGQSADDKRAKAQLLQDFFGTRSWTKVESMHSEDLRKGLDEMNRILGGHQPELPKAEDDLPMGPTPLSGASKAPEPAKTAPEPSTASLPKAEGQSDASLTVIRAMMRAQGIDEGKFIQMMTELGHAPDGVTTLESAEAAEPGVYDRILANWVAFTAIYSDTLKNAESKK